MMFRYALLIFAFIVAANAKEALIPTNTFTAIDTSAMLLAKRKMLSDEVAPGTRINFKGDKNSGYYEYASTGHLNGREDVHCREIHMFAGPLSDAKIYCHLNRENEWPVTAPKDYVLDASHILAPDHDDDEPAQVSTGETIFR